MVLKLVSHFLLDYFKQSKQRGKRKPQKETKESTHFSNKVVEIIADEFFNVHNPWIAPKQPKSTHTIPRSIRAFELFLQNDFMTRSHGVAFSKHWVIIHASIKKLCGIEQIIGDLIHGTEILIDGFFQDIIILFA